MYVLEGLRDLSLVGLVTVKSGLDISPIGSIEMLVLGARRKP